MAAQPGSISSRPAAGALTGGELLPCDQDIGAPVSATSLVVGQGYRIVALGTTNWQAVGAGTGATVGTIFTCESVGAGTGTAQLVDCRRVTAQTLANLAGVAAAILAHEGAADPHPGYTTSQELTSALASYLTTAAAAQAYQPLDSDLTALAGLAGQTAFGRAFLSLADAAASRGYLGLGATDAAAFASLSLTGLATLPHIHGNLAGSLYAHVKNVSGGVLEVGTPLRPIGTVGDTTVLQVVAANASSSATMPALFVLSEQLSNNAEGHATLLGEITGLNTSGLTPGAPLFVPVGGGLMTPSRPASNAQQVATVGRVHATTGSVHVLPWPVLGTAAAASTADFATAAQGALAATAVQPAALAAYALLNDSRIVGALQALDAAALYQPLDSDLSAIAALTTSSFGRAFLSLADKAAARNYIDAGTSNLALGTAAPLGLAGAAAAGSASTASPSDHQHQRDATTFVVPLSFTTAPAGNSANIIARLSLPFSFDILSVTLECESAVTTNPIIVNITLGGTTIFSTKPQINVGGTTTGNNPVFSITTGAAGSILRFYIDQAAGGGLFLNANVTIRRTN